MDIPFAMINGLAKSAVPNHRRHGRTTTSEHPKATQRHNLVSSLCLPEAGLEGAHHGA
jgi:hypothetical protein